MREIEDMEAFDEWVADPSRMPAAVQALDLTNRTSVLCSLPAQGSLFLACTMDPQAAGRLVARGAVVVPQMPGSFSVHRSALYLAEELYDTFDPAVEGSFEQCLDTRVYEEWVKQGRDRPSRIDVSFARSLHDHSITSALDSKLEGQRVVAIMGGHGLERRDPMYAHVVRIAKRLAERSYLIVTGGGPGAMEAGHLGAWLAGRPDEVIDEVLNSAFVARASDAVAGTEYADTDWLARAWHVRERWPRVGHVESIGIPTWLYGHEPPTPFATHIAKYFANAIREEGLLAIATHGVVFAPGSAGTIQEIFQDACQNHYGTQGLVSPMVLLGTEYWTETKPVWSFLTSVAAGNTYRELLTLVDEPEQVVRWIQDFEPSWYRVSLDPDVTLATALRHDLRIRENFQFEVDACSEPDPALAAALLGLTGPVDGPLSPKAFGDALFEVLTDNWVDPDALEDAMIHVDAEVYRVDGRMLLARESGCSAWSFRLDD